MVIQGCETRSGPFSTNQDGFASSIVEEPKSLKAVQSAPNTISTPGLPDSQEMMPAVLEKVEGAEDEVEKARPGGLGASPQGRRRNDTGTVMRQQEKGFIELPFFFGR